MITTSTTLVLTSLSWIISVCIAFWLGRRFSLFSYRKGLEDGCIFEKARFQKQISNLNTKLDESFTEKELNTLANIKK